MKPGTQKEIIIDHGDGLCSKLMIEPSTDEALNAFMDPMPPRTLPCPCRVRDDCRERQRSPTPNIGARLRGPSASLSVP